VEREEQTSRAGRGGVRVTMAVEQRDSHRPLRSRYAAGGIRCEKDA